MESISHLHSHQQSLDYTTFADPMPKAEFVAQKCIKGSQCILFHQAHGTGKAAAGVVGTECICFTFSSIPGFARRREEHHTPRDRTGSRLIELADRHSAQLGRMDGQRSAAQGARTKATVNYQAGHLSACFPKGRRTCNLKSPLYSII